MIKLIATDLDGTLLDDAHALPEKIFPLIGEMTRRGVLFCVASGRQYANLVSLFHPVADEILFMAENGALIKYRGRTLYENPIDECMISDALTAISRVRGLYPMLCGEDNAYIACDDARFYAVATASYTNLRRISSLESAIGKEPIAKIAVYDPFRSSEKHIGALKESLTDLRVALSGSDWFDVSSKRADKGNAMRFIKEYFGLRKEECVAFGDHMNDYEMLLECGEAFVTENAYPPLKERIRRTVPANAEGGVLLQIEKILEV